MSNIMKLHNIGHKYSEISFQKASFLLKSGICFKQMALSSLKLHLWASRGQTYQNNVNQRKNGLQKQITGTLY